MTGGIYVLRNNEELVALSEQQYDSEDLLQTLLAKYPSILAGDQISPSAPRKWLLVKREAEVPGEEGGGGRWSLDHLFLDQDGIPTLVEVKRSTDTRIRREVVGQMLDYAANAMAYWSIDSVRANFEQTCARLEQEPDSVLSDFLAPEDDPEAFWQAVKTNLKAGKLRLLFVADQIPSELRRIVEFLNAQMDPAEVLAVEIKQFAGESLKTLVPRVIGQTAEAEGRKGTGTRSTRQWDEPAFFAELANQNPPEHVEVARRIFNWAGERGLEAAWGRGAINGSFSPTLEHLGVSYSIFTVYLRGTKSGGKVEVNFAYWARCAPFEDAETRREILQRLNAIPELSIPADGVDRHPPIPLATLAKGDALDRFLAVMDSHVSKVRQA